MPWQSGNTGGGGGPCDWSEVDNKPTVFPPASHGHPQADITGLVAALAAKANSSHAHAISDTTGLQTALDDKVDEALLDAKGDLYVASAADTPARLPVGSDGQVLTASSGAATGVAWATLSGGGAPYFAQWVPVESVQGALAAAVAASTYTFDLAGITRASGAATTSPVVLIPVVAADWSVAGKTTQLRVRMVLQTNATAPTINFTAGLYPVSAVGGGANTTITTFGAVVTGSTVTRSAPAASSAFTDDSAPFTIPADGRYVLAVQLSGAMPATNPRVHVHLSLAVRHV